MMDYDVIWSGSHKDTYLCVREPQTAAVTYRPYAPLPPIYKDWTVEKRRVLAALAARPAWKITELRAYVQLSSRVLHGFLQRWKDAGQVESLSYGVVALVARERAS